tara:strand:- start:18992 stop:19789 length:798 start_codon:yes stop_codon:yes gene_type:complete
MAISADNELSSLFLWPLRTLFVGRIGRLSSLSPGAHAVLVGLDGDMDLIVGDYQFCARSFLVPAGLRFTGDAHGGRIACCFLDPLGRDFLFHQPLMKHCEEGVYFHSRRQAEQVAALESVYSQGGDATQAYQLLLDLLFPSISEKFNDFKVDERIVKIIEVIRTDPSENISNDELGAVVGLSGARLQRLFKEATGIPIRRYRLWHRLFVTSSMMAMGSTLTDAALAAGFSDSSHLNHVFKDMLGMKPSSVLRQTRQMKIFMGSDS